MRGRGGKKREVESGSREERKTKDTGKDRAGGSGLRVTGARRRERPELAPSRRGHAGLLKERRMSLCISVEQGKSHQQTLLKSFPHQ